MKLDYLQDIRDDYMMMVVFLYTGFFHNRKDPIFFDFLQGCGVMVAQEALTLQISVRI